MRNEMLIANAGSGKTHALTTRVIRLLASGVEPRQIAALTFTRKAAGELLAGTFERLANAALDKKALSDLASHTDRPDLDFDQCRSLLARLVSQLGELGMGTIDSFFTRIARVFPLECGLSEDFRIAPEVEVEAARENALDALFQTESRADAGLAAFIDLFRRIARRLGERNVFETLRRGVEKLHATYLDTPSGFVWGDASSIWGRVGCPVLDARPLREAASELISGIERDLPDLDSKALAKWKADCALVAEHTPGSMFSSNLKAFFKKLSNVKTAPDGRAYIPTGNAHAARLYFVEAIPDLLEEMKLSLARPVFEEALTRSRALHEFMSRFESIYSARVRSSGIVTFSDITDLLSRRAGSEDWRIAVGYRLDQRFDHWLLDEFQDTSRAQWNVLRAFIEEILMDPTGSRSFFYVGDTKQAIYSWRGGDPGLFHEIFAEYRAALEEGPALTESYRSCPEILDFVNAVFGNPASLIEPLRLPSLAVEKWLLGWREHEPSPVTRNRVGHVCWSAVEEEDSGSEDLASPQDREVLRILKQVEPWKRGVSCAVLKRDNKGIAILAGLLQSQGIPVAVEGRMNPCVDNPLGAAVLAALRMAVSPSDKISRVIAVGFPALAVLGVDKPFDFRNRTLAQIAVSGFAPLLRGWIAEMSLNSEPFLASRALELFDAAEEFDLSRKPSDGAGEFLSFLEKRQTTEAEATGAVRLMTIHQAKGLGFDMVICSGLDSASPNNRADKLALGPDLKHPSWGLVLPPADFLECDPLLDRRAMEIEADERYGEICTAYVALTRSKTALYVVTNRLKENTTSTNFARWLSLSVGQPPYRSGNPDWFASLPAIPLEKQAAAESPAPQFHRPVRGTPRAKTPSSSKLDHVSRREEIASPENIDPAELGTEVHAALAQVEWIGTESPVFTDLTREARILLEDFFGRSEAREIFAQPTGRHILWREQPFDVQLDGEWVGGIFDRVVMKIGEADRPTSAVIYDFKTDQATCSEIEIRYAEQMKTYRRALCAITGLAFEAVEVRLVGIR
jgi:ATP-dependent exoDNAse (exonuclease V) beta subunit